MKNLDLYYVTNRAHEGKDRLRPRRYGNKFSDDGAENLRFGRLRVPLSRESSAKLHNALSSAEVADPADLKGLLSAQARNASLQAYRERVPRPDRSEHAQAGVIYGSQKMFAELRRLMSRGHDVLVYVHGYNTAWEEAVGSALALQSMLNRPAVRGKHRRLYVVLFSWPSDGSLLPFVAYRSDRVEAAASGFALGRALLKMRDFLRTIGSAESCGRNVHLLAHSLGAHVLETALERIATHAGGTALPRLLDHLVLCAPDVDDDTLQPGRSLGRLHELGCQLSVYFNRDDVVLRISDLTKGHPERLGNTGAAHPHLLHQKIHQIDCSSAAGDLIGHHYHLQDRVSGDIRKTLDGFPQDDPSRGRERGVSAHTWILR